MLLIQFTGLSGAGKSTIAKAVQGLLRSRGYHAEVIDGDVYRKVICPDLGFSREDRNENIRRLGFIANVLATNGVIALLAAINPYEEIRKELSAYGAHVKTVWVDCAMPTLVDRDTKGLYRKALLPDDHPEKIRNLTGVNDPFEVPVNADLVISTHLQNEEESVRALYEFIIGHIDIIPG